jgi:thiamine-phosphate pyrophosphorylase
MKVILLSKPRYDEEEIDLVKIMFESGLENFHLRKPRVTTNQMKKILDKIPSQFHDRIVIHSHHHLARVYNLKGVHYTRSHFKNSIKNWWRKWMLSYFKPSILKTRSFTNLTSLYEKDEQVYEYVMLYPIFDSLTGNFQSGYHEQGIKNAIQKSNKKIVARGGVDSKKIEQIRELGFYGMVLNSNIWKSKEPLASFNEFMGKCKELNIQVE